MEEKKSVKQCILEKIQENTDGVSPKNLVDLIGKPLNNISAHISLLRTTGHKIVLYNGRYVYQGKLEPTERKIIKDQKEVLKPKKNIIQKVSSIKKSSTDKLELFIYHEDKIASFIKQLSEHQKREMEPLIEKTLQLCKIINDTYQAFNKISLIFQNLKDYIHE